MMQDLRYALRTLSRTPGFALVALLTLAIGIGANTAIFSVINAVMLKPLPFVDADRLAIVWETHPDLPRVGPSIPDVEDWRAQAASFEGVAVYANRLRNALLMGAGEPTHVQGTMVSREFFSLLGIKPVLGRDFVPEEGTPGKDQVVILSRTLWRQRFAADPNVLGKSVQLNERAFTIVGVMGASYPEEADLWLPLSQLGAATITSRMDHRSTAVLARLKPGVTEAAANRELQGIAAQLQQRYPESNKSLGATMLPLRAYLSENLRGVAGPVFLAVALVLLIACANVSNLMLARSLARQREFALRAALGAGRARLARQLLAESGLLAVAGGLLGLALAWLCLPLLTSVWLSLGNPKMHGLDEVGLDWRTLAFAFGVTLLASLVFGLAPALRGASADPNQSLKEGGKGTVGGGRRLGGALVAAEVALAVIVLIGAGLLARSMQRLLRVDPGFCTDRVLSLKIDLPTTRYASDAPVREFYERLIPRLQALPGVAQFSFVDSMPFTANMNLARFAPEGAPASPGRERLARLKSVDHRFFDMLRVPLRQGRLFTEADVQGPARHQVIVNETMARRLEAGTGPIGAHLKMDWGATLEIVGVVADIKDLGLDQPVEPEIYFPAIGREAVLLVQTKTDPAALAPAIRDAVLSLEPQQPINPIKPLSERLADSLARRRFLLASLGLSALLALALAAIGIYGVVAYFVAQRTQEIGIRRALGAQSADLFRLVLGRGLIPAGLGLGIGFAGALALARLLPSLLEGFLFEVRADDPTTFLAIALALLAVAALACCLPARRATKVDPMVALRSE